MNELENHENEIYEDEDLEDYIFCPVCGCDINASVDENGDVIYPCHCGYKERY